LFARCRFETRLEVQVLYFCRSSERWQDPVLQYLLQILDVQVLAAARTRIFRLPAALRCTGLEDGAGGGQRFVRSGLPSANDSVLLAPTSCRCLKSWSWILMPCRALGCLVSLPIILPTSSSHSRRYLVTAPFLIFMSRQFPVACVQDILGKKENCHFTISTARRDRLVYTWP
jgi:hypothetical protein